MESGIADVKIEEDDLSKEPWEGKKIVLCLFSVLTQLLIAHKVALPDVEQTITEAKDLNTLRGLFLGVVTRLNETTATQQANLQLLAGKCKEFIDDNLEKQLKIIALEKELVTAHKNAHDWRRVAVIGIIAAAISIAVVIRP